MDDLETPYDDETPVQYIDCMVRLQTNESADMVNVN